jgi:hypothetical protein
MELYEIDSYGRRTHISLRDISLWGHIKQLPAEYELIRTYYTYFCRILNASSKIVFKKVICRILQYQMEKSLVEDEAIKGSTPSKKP